MVRMCACACACVSCNHTCELVKQCIIGSQQGLQWLKECYAACNQGKRREKIQMKGEECVCVCEPKCMERVSGKHLNSLSH